MKSITLGNTLLGYSLATEQVLYPREGNLKVPTVNTTSRMVSGHAAPNTTGVSEYLGIPFAEPPVGELRFAPPQSYKGNGHISGTKYYEPGLTIALGLTDPSAVSHSQAYWDSVDEHSICSVPERANISISHNAPTWRYRYFGVWPDIQLSTYPDCGTWHIIDVLAVFDYIPQGPGIPNQTPEQISTGKYVRGA